MSSGLWFRRELAAFLGFISSWKKCKSLHFGLLVELNKTFEYATVAFLLQVACCRCCVMVRSDQTQGQEWRCDGEFASFTSRRSSRKTWTQTKGLFDVVKANQRWRARPMSWCCVRKLEDRNDPAAKLVWVTRRDIWIFRAWSERTARQTAPRVSYFVLCGVKPKNALTSQAYLRSIGHGAGQTDSGRRTTV